MSPLVLGGGHDALHRRVGDLRLVGEHAAGPCSSRLGIVAGQREVLRDVIDVG